MASSMPPSSLRPRPGRFPPRRSAADPRPSQAEARRREPGGAERRKALLKPAVGLQLQGGNDIAQEIPDDDGPGAESLERGRGPSSAHRVARDIDADADHKPCQRAILSRRGFEQDS